MNKNGHSGAPCRRKTQAARHGTTLCAQGGLCVRARARARVCVWRRGRACMNAHVRQRPLAANERPQSPARSTARRRAVADQRGRPHPRGWRRRAKAARGKAKKILGLPHPPAERPLRAHIGAVRDERVGHRRVPEVRGVVQRRPAAAKWQRRLPHSSRQSVGCAAGTRVWAGDGRPRREEAGRKQRRANKQTNNQTNNRACGIESANRNASVPRTRSTLSTRARTYAHASSYAGDSVPRYYSGVPALISRVHVGSVREQQLDHELVPLPGGDMQRRPTAKTEGRCASLRIWRR
jgi:hypothetical protein